MKKFIFKLRAW